MLNAVMYRPIYRLICFSVFVGIMECSTYVLSGNNVMPRFERNKVNKGVWFRNRQDPIKSNLGFIFRANSLESQAQTRFDAFNSKQENLASGFMERYKREPHSTITKRRRKSIINKNKGNFTASYINVYPYDVSVRRDSPNNKNIDYNVYPKSTTKIIVEERNNTEEGVTERKVDIKHKKKQEKPTDITIEYLKDVVNASGNGSMPKRSMKYENDRINLFDVGNGNVIGNNILKEEGVQLAPVTDVVYEIVPKEPKDEQRRVKTVSEGGLIKVISMLTKTFKKIMKQHNDIKGIHSQMHTLNEECKLNIEKHSKRLEDFDVKYAFFLKFMEKLKMLQDKLKSKEESFKKKEEEMSRYLLNLEGQQKKFLQLQQQFFNVQKAMLAQNEKINQKQNAIAKTQNDISLRQKTFARVLEKVKNQNLDGKYLQYSTTMDKKTVLKNITEEKKIHAPLMTTEPVKINLFSIPSSKAVLNHDEMILREIHDKPIDDLIYKYYFNNTFIDTVIKNKILPGFVISDKAAIARNAKHKRNKHKTNPNITVNINNSTGTNITQIDSTLLLPVYNENITNSTSHRERRWINHHSRKRHRKHHGKGNSMPTHHSSNITETNNINNIKTAEPIPVKSVADDPFMKMATHFCNEIGQNSTKQILDWCVEKALRKLQSLDTKLMASPDPANIVQETTQLYTTASSYIPQSRTTKQVTLFVTEVPAATIPTSTPLITTTEAITQTVSDGNAFFPDNDELETNLKQFDLTKDPVGNVYYDGSLHASDMGVHDKSEGKSDTIPGLDSSSRAEDTKILIQPIMKGLNIKRIQSLKNMQRIGRRKL